MFGNIKRALVTGAVAGALLMQAVPASAAQGDIYFNPNSQSVAKGATFTADVMVDLGSSHSLGYQFGFTFNKDLLQVDSVVASSVWNDYIASTPSGDMNFPVDWVIDNANGVVIAGAEGIVNDKGNGGPTGLVKVATVTMTAKNVDGISPLTLTDLVLDIPAHGVNGSVTVGTPPAPDLIITGQSTSGTNANYELSFTVKNNGTATAGASKATYAIDGGTAVEVDIPTLNAGAEQPIGPIALVLSGTSDNILITADALNAVAESNETNNTTTTAYAWSPIGDSGQFPINAQLASFIDLTAPAEISGWVLTAGQNNDRAGGTLNVKANVNWAVQISGTNAGKMHEYNNSTSQFVNPGAELIQQLQIGSENPLQSLTGSLAAFCDGLRTEQVPSTGHDFAISLRQFVGYNDQPITDANNGYRAVATFVAAPQP